MQFEKAASVGVVVVVSLMALIVTKAAMAGGRLNSYVLHIPYVRFYMCALWRFSWRSTALFMTVFVALLVTKAAMAHGRPTIMAALPAESPASSHHAYRH